MDSQVLALRLHNMDEESLRSLHERLVTICTGRPSDARPELQREFWIIETTDSERGGVVRDLLGTAPGLGDEWLPDGIKHLHLNSTLRYKSLPPGESVKFTHEFPGANSVSLEETSALDLLKSGHTNSRFPLCIQAGFTGLYAGWSCLLEPPVKPANVFKEVLSRLPAGACWILVCPNSETAHQVLSESNERSLCTPPALIVLEQPQNSVPAHIDDFRVASRLEATSLIRNLCDRSDLFIKPDKQRLIQSIRAIHHQASMVVTQSKAGRKRNLSIEFALEKASIKWEKMFITERREALNDIRLRIVTHPIQKSMLVMRGEREAQVAYYARTHLLPLIRNFLRSQVLELRTTEFNSDPTEFDITAIKKKQPESHLRAGLLFALPSLGLLLPNFAIPPSEIVGAVTEAPAPAETPTSAESVDCSISGDGLWPADFKPLSWFSEKICDMFDAGKEAVGEIIAAPLKGIEDQFKELNSTLGKVLGMLVMGQVAVGIAVVIGAAIVAKGSLSLTETEKMIKDLLDDIEKKWPEIRKNLEQLLPTLQGQVDPEILKRANTVIQTIDEI